MEYVNLDVWQQSRILVKEVYEILGSFPVEELYGLTNQIKRCAISVPSNIAEGCGRQYSKETIHFLYVSRGSLYELETQLYLALDLGYITREKLDSISIQVESCKKLLNGFINYFKKKEA